MSHEARWVLARSVRWLRRARGWSQERLAEQSGLHRTYIGAIERAERNVSLNNIARIAAALDTDVGSLLYHPHGARKRPERVREQRPRYAAGLTSRAERVLSSPSDPSPAANRPHIATYSRSTVQRKIPLIDSHDGIGKEATRPTGQAVTHQPRLVSGGIG